MRASEVLRWCYRHYADLSFDKNSGGVLMTVKVMKPKGKQVKYELLLRHHDTVADDVARFIDKVSVETNME